MIPDTFSFCPRCASRVEIGRVPLGSKLTCWSCGFEFVLARGVEGRAATGQGRGEGKGEDRRHARDAQKKPTPAEEDHWAREATGGMPPLGLFFSGTFRFPFYLATLSESLGLSIGAVVLVAGIRLALWCYHADNEAIDPSTRVLLWNGLMLSGAFGGVFALVWACAAGRLRTDDPPRHVPRGRRDRELAQPAAAGRAGRVRLHGQCRGALGAAGPAGHVALALAGSPPAAWALRVTVPVLFPIFLLSMLETRSPTDPVSLAVWRSVLYAWRAWLAFYLIALATAVVAAALVAAAIRQAGGAVGLVATGVLPTVAWMIYFRLLGRLAWFCSGRWAREHREGTGVGYAQHNAGWLMLTHNLRSRMAYGLVGR